MPNNIIRNVIPPAQGARIAAPSHPAMYGYGAHARPSAAVRRPGPIIAAVGIPLVIAAALLILVLFPWPCTAAVNGVTVDSNVKTSVQDLVATQNLQMKPGDLVAVDGSVLEEGGGEAMHINVNGEYVGNDARLVQPGDVIEVTDGDNSMEPFVEELQTFTAPARIEGTGAVHLYTQIGEDGERIVRTGSISGKTVETQVTKDPVETVVECFNIDTGDDKVIALTFDDGPWGESTEQILDVLGANGAKATFFTVGECTTGREATVRKAAEAGHQICTHTWDHASGSGNGVDLGRMSHEERVTEVRQGQQVNAEITGQEVDSVIRVPGGNFNEETAGVLAPYVTAEIGWNIDTHDWERPGASAIYQQIMYAKPGYIILMHDGGGDRSQTVSALRDALPQLAAQGYRFITIDELLAYANK